MSAVDPRRVREAFEAAMDLSGDRRSAMLDQHCAGEEALRREVDSLLRHHDATHGALADGQIGLGLRLAADAPPPAGAASTRVPQRIGEYRVLRLLGAGGMGVVYLAEQDEPRRTVAVKLMRGDILSPELLKRFKREAQVLGRLQHPGIAHIYDAGVATLDGLERAYFAMEYIDGVSLTEFARREGLDKSQRLELVAKVCDAVQHAHERGVVHRDLKPGNILVDADGRVRVLDFGVALASSANLQTMTLQTEPGQLIGTLQYMSPEQVGGAAGRIDARSDVYAIGVIAFEMLTGEPPYRVRELSIAEAARTIQEVEPTRIGQLDTRLRGDIEVILSKALEKDRNRRYASAAEFASDIRRHLGDQPIVARPATTLYWMQKFARRNKALVGGVFGVFVALVAGLIGTTWMYLEADRARRLAENEREIARQESAIARATNQFLVDDLLASPNPWTTGGREMTVASVLDRASGGVAARFAAAPEVEAAIRATLGDSYAALGLFAEAQPHLERAAELQQKSKNPDPERVLAAERRKAANLQLLGRFDEAETIIQRVLAETTRIASHDSIARAECLEVLADIQNGKSLYADAEKTMREAIRIRRLRTPAGDVDLARALNTLGSALHYRGDQPQASQVKLEALAELRRLVGDDHPLVTQVLHDIGSGLVEQHRYAEAIEYFEQAAPLLARQLGPDHRVVLANQRSFGTALSFAGRHAEATPLLEKAITASAASLGADHPETLAAINCLATSYLRTNRPADAANLLEKLAAQSERALGPRHAETLKYRHNLAWCHQKTGKFDVAEQMFREALSGYEATLGPLHPDTQKLLDALAWNMESQKRYGEAAEFLRRVIGLRREAGIAPDMGDALFLNRQGTYCMQAEDHGGAWGPLAESVELCAANLPPFDRRLGIARGKLGEALSKLGEFEAAEAMLQMSLAAFRVHCGSAPDDVVAGLRRLVAHFERSGEADRAAAARAELTELAGS
ncbi:MAG: tetratricopeptide repeat protein [Phycisphaerae bacterium]|nr:tetratricopeptide repeat protein [Phycisphaerae bacterium]